jgi:hypothetical protein
VNGALIVEKVDLSSEVVFGLEAEDLGGRDVQVHQDVLEGGAVPGLGRAALLHQQLVPVGAGGWNRQLKPRQQLTSGTRRWFLIPGNEIWHPGVDVMITIFSDFRQLFAKIGVFLKNQCYDPIFALFNFVLSKKRKIFAFFGENI